MQNVCQLYYGVYHIKQDSNVFNMYGKQTHESHSRRIKLLTTCMQELTRETGMIIIYDDPSIKFDGVIRERI